MCRGRPKIPPAAARLPVRPDSNLIGASSQASQSRSRKNLKQLAVALTSEPGLTDSESVGLVEPSESESAKFNY